MRANDMAPIAQRSGTGLLFLAAFLGRLRMMLLVSQSHSDVGTQDAWLDKTKPGTQCFVLEKTSFDTRREDSHLFFVHPISPFRTCGWNRESMWVGVVILYHENSGTLYGLRPCPQQA